MNRKREKFFSKEVTKWDLLILDILTIIGVLFVVFCAVLIVLISNLY